jgi:hypothetical protein
MASKKIIIEEAAKIKPVIPKKTAKPSPKPRKKKEKAAELNPEKIKSETILPAESESNDKNSASLDLRGYAPQINITVDEPAKTIAGGAEITDKEPQEKDKKIEVQIGGGSFMEKLKRAELEKSKVIAKETEEANEAEKTKEPISPSKLRLYKKIAISFIGLTVVLLAAVAYFLLLKTTIVLISNQERVANNLIVDVYGSESGQTADSASISGKIDETIVSDEKIFPATGSSILGEKLVGQVIIYNNYVKNQPLVATTRLQAPDGKIYRIKDTVNVPAGGSVPVEIYSDDQDTDLTMGATKFILPGLWAGIQDKIYAEAKDGLKKERQVKKIVQQSDIDSGINALKEALVAKAKSELGEKYSSYNQVIYNIDDGSVSTEADAQAGDEKDEIKIKINAQVFITAFNEEPVIKIAGEKLSSGLPANKTLLEISKKNISYTVDSFDFDQNKSSLNVSFEAIMVLKKDANIIDKKSLAGLSKSELEQRLNELPEIAGYEIKFFPSFIKRAPYLADRIKVEIKE